MVFTSRRHASQPGQYDLGELPSNSTLDEDYDYKHKDKYKTQVERYDPNEGDWILEQQNIYQRRDNPIECRDECWPSGPKECLDKTKQMSEDELLSTVKEEHSSYISAQHSAPTRIRKGKGHDFFLPRLNSSELSRKEDEQHLNYEQAQHHPEENVAEDNMYESPPDQVGAMLMLNKSTSDLSSITDTCYSQNSRYRKEILNDILRGKIPHFLDKDKIEAILHGTDVDQDNDNDDSTTEGNKSLVGSLSSDNKTGVNTAKGRGLQKTPSKSLYSFSKSNSTKSSHTVKAQNLRHVNRMDGSSYKDQARDFDCSASYTSMRSSRSNRSGSQKSSKSLKQKLSLKSSNSLLSPSNSTLDHSTVSDESTVSEYHSATNWANIAVFAASSVLDAGGSQEAAEAATHAILRVGSKMGSYREGGLAVAAEASTAVLATENGQSTAAVAAVAVLKACGAQVPEDVFDEVSSYNSSIRCAPRNNINGLKQQGSSDKTTKSNDMTCASTLDGYEANDEYSNKENLTIPFRRSDSRVSSKFKSSSSQGSSQVLTPSKNRNQSPEKSMDKKRSNLCTTSNHSNSSSSSRRSKKQINNTSSGGSVVGDLSSFLDKSGTKIAKSMNQSKDSDMFSIKSSDIINHMSDLTKYVSTLMSPPKTQKPTATTATVASSVLTDYRMDGADSITIINKNHKCNHYRTQNDRMNNNNYGGEHGENSSRDGTCFDDDTYTIKSEFELGAHLMRMEESSNEIELSLLASRTKEILNEIKGDTHVVSNDERKTVLSKARKHLVKLVKNKREKKS